MQGQNIESLVAMYWEGDRSGVKLRYTELFGDESSVEDAIGTNVDVEASIADIETTGEDQVNRLVNAVDGVDSIHQDLDEDFLAVLDEIALTERLEVAAAEYWTAFDWRTKTVVLQYLYDLGNKDIALASPLEGLLRFFGIGIASHISHVLFPDSVFPIGEDFTDLSYRQLRQALDLLDIQCDDVKTQLPIDVWLNLSAAIEEYRQDHALEHWEMWALVYDFGPRILPAPGPYPSLPSPRIWIVSTNDSLGEFARIDQHGSENVGTWAINPKAKYGDIALMYCVSPRSAFVSVYRCAEDAHSDPFGGWNGYRGQITDKIPIPWITFSEMKTDPVLGEWGLVRSQFQGLLKHEVPQEIWHRLIDLVVEKDQETGERLRQFAHAGEGTRMIKVSGEDWSEAEVEEQLVIPVLNELGWRIDETIVRQVPMLIKVGSGQPKCVKADFVGYYDRLTSEPLLVIETKRKVGSTKELDFAKEQAESYAGKLRCTRFGVAAPEGFWIYELKFPGQSQQLASVELYKEVSKVEIGKLHQFIGFNTLKAQHG